MTTHALSFLLRHRLRRLSYPILMALTILGLSNQSIALPTLSADKRIDSIPVKIGGMEEAFTVIQDARDPRQWYYVPDRPRLFERTVGKKTEPDFTLIRYQYKNPNNPSDLLEGGLLQFAVSLAIPPKALKQLAKAIAQHERSVSQTQSTGPESLSTEIRSKVFQKVSDAISKQSGDLETTNQHNKLQQPMDVLDEKEIRLSALPLNSAQVALYIPEQAEQDKQEATFLASAPLGGGIAPMFATQKMVFSVHLKRQGADLYDTLVNTNTGLPIVVTMKFSALTPPAGFKITVDWDRLYSYYSEHEQFRRASALSLSDWNIWDVSSHLEKEELLDVLISNKLVNIEVIEGTGFDLTKIQPYIDSILQRINKELLAEFQPPEKIQLANLDKSKSDKKEQSDDKGEKSDEESKKSELDKDKDYLISAHYAVAMKNRAQVKRGKETIHFNVMTHVESTTIAGGFIGIGHYPKKLRERLVTTVKPGPWESAFFVLPVVADAKALGISQIDFQVALLHKKKRFDAQLLNWIPDKGWRDRNNLSRNVIAFPLAHLYHRLGRENIEQVKFKTQTQITLGRDVLKVTQVIPMITGEVPIATPLSAVDVLEVDGDTLNWRRVDKEATLTRVSVALKSGQRRFKGTLRPRRIDGEWLMPKPLYWLLPKNSEEPITAKIRYRYKRSNNKAVVQKYEDIREIFPDLFIHLDELLEEDEDEQDEDL